MGSMFTALKKYAVFEGRARRSELWLWVLFQFLLGIVILIVGRAIDGNNVGVYGTGGPVTVGLRSLVGLAFLLPNIGVGVRRLHDSDKTGWLQLLWFIPVIGWIALIVLFCLPGTVGPNKYGADPKMPAATTAETFA